MKTIVVSGSIVVICGLYSQQYDSILKCFKYTYVV